MDYIEAFKSLKTNNKYGRKSPHKAILLLTVIELYETNVLSDNVILYDEILKNTFQKVWERTLREEPLFHPEVYFPFWYMQTEDFWHIVPIRGKEDVLALMRDTNVKPSESKLIDCVRYAELDEDLYFLMTLPSGRSSLKRALLEAYTDLSGSQIDKLSKSEYNAVDYSVEALSDYKKILSRSKNEIKKEVVEADCKLVEHFKKLSEDLQIVLNLQYFLFLKSHRNERDLFKELFPTVYDLYNCIVNRPLKRSDISPTFAIIYDNFLSDLRISLMGEDGSMELINKIDESLNLLRGEIENEAFVDTAEKNDILQPQVTDVIPPKTPAVHIPSSYDKLEIEDVYVDSLGKITNSSSSAPKTRSDEIPVIESRKGKAWTEEEERIIKQDFEQGKDFSTIAAFVGRTEVAIKARLAKLGLIDYTYKLENETTASVQQSSMYVEKKNAILRAMKFFRIPASTKDITRTISRTAWGGIVKEDDVALILSTMDEVVSVHGKYVLRK